MTTVYIGSRQTIFLNTYDVIKDAFVKHGNLFSGRPQDLFYLKELCDNIGEIYLHLIHYNHAIELQGENNLKWHLKVIKYPYVKCTLCCFGFFFLENFTQFSTRC